MNNNSRRHSPDECTSVPCADDRCVNGFYAIAQAAAAQLLLATQQATAERAAVAYGHAPTQPVESMEAMHGDLEFVLDLLADAPAHSLRYFLSALKGHLPDVLRLPIDPTTPREHLAEKAANYIRP